MTHIAVVDPAMRIPELDCFNRMSRSSPVPLTYHLPALFGTDSLGAVEGDLLGVIVLGSGASVNEDHPWQTRLRSWLRPRIEAGVPMLGLCYGHQLLATLLGGEVGQAFSDAHKAQGLRRVRLRDNPLWGEAREGTLLVSHREAVIRVPADTDVVGTSDDLAVEALAHRSLPIWSFQAHPEATPEFASNNGVPFDGPPEVLGFGHGIVDRFLRRVATDR